jgi:polyphosphate kinase 2 (PPK2 family)
MNIMHSTDAELQTRYARYLETMKAYRFAPLDFPTWSNWQRYHDAQGTPHLLR